MRWAKRTPLPYLSSSPPKEDDGVDEPWSLECPHDGAGDGAGLEDVWLGPAQLGAAGGGVGAGAGAVTAGFGAAGLATGLGATGLGAAGLGAGGAATALGAALATLFLAVALLADFLADFFADFFGAALAFLADLLAFFADFLAVFFAAFFEVFLAVLFFAVRAFFLLLLFLPFLFFFPLAIVILLLPLIHVYRASNLSSAFRAAAIDQFNPGLEPPVAQSRSSTVCTTGTDVPLAICTMHPILPAAIMSGPTIAILATFRSRNRFAMSGWRML